MVELTAEYIFAIHKEIEETFPTVQKGIDKPGLVEAIVERPSQLLFGKLEPFDNIFTKAASLMEAIIRLHPFTDGNKRTGLLAAFAYLYVNGYYLAIPLDAVRFTVRIASEENPDQEKITQLINEIAQWLKYRTGKNDNDFLGKAVIYSFLPIMGLIILSKIGFKKYVKKKLDYWFSVKEHPEYEKEMGNIVSFLIGKVKRTYDEVIQRREDEKRKKKKQLK